MNRRPRRHPVLKTIGLLVLVYVAWHVLAAAPWLLLALPVAGVIAWRRRSRRPASREPLGDVTWTPSPGVPPNVTPIRRPGDARARRNGWTPPARAALVDVPMSAECSDDDHVGCPGTPDCRCPCAHDSAVIVAMNRARHAAGTGVPF